MYAKIIFGKQEEEMRRQVLTMELCVVESQTEDNLVQDYVFVMGRR